MVDLGRKDCIMVTTFEAESSEDIITQVMPAKLLEVGTAAFKDRQVQLLKNLQSKSEHMVHHKP